MWAGLWNTMRRGRLGSGPAAVWAVLLTAVGLGGPAPLGPSSAARQWVTQPAAGYLSDDVIVSRRCGSGPQSARLGSARRAAVGGASCVRHSRGRERERSLPATCTGEHPPASRNFDVLRPDSRREESSALRHPRTSTLRDSGLSS